MFDMNDRRAGANGKKRAELARLIYDALCAAGAALGDSGG
jgi:hypothetical protein